MNQENGWPAPLPGVLNPIDDPYAAAQQMAVAVIGSGLLPLPQDAEKAAEYIYEFQRMLTEQYRKLRGVYDLSDSQG